VHQPHLRPARLEDYEKIRQLGLSFSLTIPLEEDWRNLWLNNPLRERADELPLGWVLETAGGEMVGTMGTVLVPYSLGGNQLVSAVSRAWFVKPEYRSFALQLMDQYLNQPGVDLFINNAVSVPALEAFKRFCSPIPLGCWDCASYWEPSDIPGSPAAGLSDVETVDRFDASFDEFWLELVRHNPATLLAERTVRTLAWHYAASQRRGRLWILTLAQQTKLKAYMTLVRQDRAFELPALAADGSPLRPSIRLADFQTLEPERDFLSPLLNAALARCAAEGLVLEHLGRGVPKMRRLDESAPRIKRLENWKFFYAAAHPKLAATLESAAVWDPSAYDGDASFE
jgi:hypothetical protein